MLQCLGGPFLNCVQACSPDEIFRKGLSFCDILCVFTIWLHTSPDSSLWVCVIDIQVKQTSKELRGTKAKADILIRERFR